MVAVALAEEIGITNGASPHPRDDDAVADPEATDEIVDALAAFVGALAPPERAGVAPEGERLFARIGCTDCHRPALGNVTGAYTDLCVHSMGPTFDTLVQESEYSARPDEWRTAPLWGLRFRKRFLHDDGAPTTDAAIRRHGGEAEPARRRYEALAPAQRDAINRFLSTL
jgi:CxxC motif-containing protein (DUF1111 family)